VRKEEGFSLIELLVVVTIIGVIAALAIPNLRRARQYAESASAVQSLRTISTAEYLFKNKYKRFGTLAELAPEGTIDTSLGLGRKSNYFFELLLVDDPDYPDPAARHFTCTGAPESDPARSDYFFVDDTGVIRFETGVAADKDSPPIPK
jgi:prepilin-type N-terminal cleavage/methylation domain-containing protein